MLYEGHVQTLPRWLFRSGCLDGLQEWLSTLRVEAFVLHLYSECRFHPSGTCLKESTVLEIETKMSVPPG